MISRRALFGSAASFAASTLLSSCNRGPQKRVIGVVPKGRAHLFWQSVQGGALKAARERNVEIVWNGPAVETDIPEEVKIVESLLNRRVDAICLAPIDKTGLVNVIERAAREKVPLVIFDSGVDTENFVSMVATDNYRGGVIAAERIGEILQGKGVVTIVAVQPGAASTLAREAGFEETLKAKFPGITVADKRFGMADFAKSLAAAENMLTAHPEMNAMFASNESSTVGAAQALKGRNSKVKLVGFDWSPNLKEDLVAGRIDSLVVQDPFRMGYQSVMAAVDHLDGKPVQKHNDLPARLIRKEDLGKPEVEAVINPDLKKYL